MGERRKGGGTPDHHVGVATRKPMLGELGEMGQLRVRSEREANRRWTTG